MHIFYMVFSKKKRYLFNTLSMDKISMSYLFSFSRYQTKCVVKFLSRQLMTSYTLRFILGHHLSNGRQAEKEERMEVQIFEYIENEKSFFDEIKSIFHSF